MTYRVLVDDNFHYMDEGERYELGRFDSLDGAIAACRKIVDDFLRGQYEPGMAASELYSRYRSFGEDPFVVPPDAPRPFSAWDYARERCAELCGDPEAADGPQGPADGSGGPGQNA